MLIQVWADKAQEGKLEYEIRSYTLKKGSEQHAEQPPAF